MAQVNCYLPDALKARALAELPADLSWSGLLRRGVLAALEEQEAYDDLDPVQALTDLAAIGGDVDAQANSWFDGPDAA